MLYNGDEDGGAREGLPGYGYGVDLNYATDYARKDYSPEASEEDEDEPAYNYSVGGQLSPPSSSARSSDSDDPAYNYSIDPFFSPTPSAEASEKDDPPSNYEDDPDHLHPKLNLSGVAYVSSSDFSLLRRSKVPYNGDHIEVESQDSEDASSSEEDSATPVLNSPLRRSYVSAPQRSLSPIPFTRVRMNPLGQGPWRDWNHEFQDLLDNVLEDLSHTAEKSPRFKHISTLDVEVKLQGVWSLVKEFVATATLYGTIIISEFFRPIHNKTIIPQSGVGGVAGGEKYFHGGIMFKFAMDVNNLYGRDEYAMKVASHELKGLDRYFSAAAQAKPLIKGTTPIRLHFPLMALIDHLGFRLTASSILPIRGSSSLKYGSADGGVHVYSGENDDTLGRLMKRVGKRLNLKGHLCGATAEHLLHSPADIEVHLSPDDGRYYVLDFGRVFPPTTPDTQRHPRGFLYNLMRPEYVVRYETPLSPDAFSMFGKHDPDHRVHNTEAWRATQELLTEVVPEFAEWLQEQEDQKIELTPHALVTQMHRRGINIRFMGYIRHRIRSGRVTLRRMLLNEMIARTAKNMAREKLRDKTLQSSKKNFQAVGVLVDFLNAIMGNGEFARYSIPFWQEDLFSALVHKFLPLESELSPLQQFPPTKSEAAAVVLRFADLLGIEFSTDVMHQLRRIPETLTFTFPDLVKINPRVRHLGVIEEIIGETVMRESDRASGNEATQVRLLQTAVKHFEAAAEIAADNSEVLFQLGLIHYRLALLAVNDPVRRRELGTKSLKILKEAADSGGRPSQKFVNRLGKTDVVDYGQAAMMIGKKMVEEIGEAQGREFFSFTVKSISDRLQLCGNRRSRWREAKNRGMERAVELLHAGIELGSIECLDWYRKTVRLFLHESPMKQNQLHSQREAVEEAKDRVLWKMMEAESFYWEFRLLEKQTSDQTREQVKLTAVYQEMLWTYREAAKDMKSEKMLRIVEELLIVKETRKEEWVVPEAKEAQSQYVKMRCWVELLRIRLKRLWEPLREFSPRTIELSLGWVVLEHLGQQREFNEVLQQLPPAVSFREWAEEHWEEMEKEWTERRKQNGTEEEEEEHEEAEDIETCCDKYLAETIKTHPSMMLHFVQDDHDRTYVNAQGKPKLYQRPKSLREVMGFTNLRCLLSRPALLPVLKDACKRMQFSVMHFAPLFAHSTNATGLDTLGALTHGLPLEKLSLSGCQFRDDLIESLLANHSSLTSLSLRGVCTLPQTALIRILQQSRGRLLRLSLPSGRYDGKEVTEALVQSCGSQLTALETNGFQPTDYRPLFSAVVDSRLMQSLTELDLRYSPFVHLEDLQVLLQVSSDESPEEQRRTRYCGLKILRLPIQQESHRWTMDWTSQTIEQEQLKAHSRNFWESRGREMEEHPLRSQDDCIKAGICTYFLRGTVGEEEQGLTSCITCNLLQANGKGLCDSCAEEHTALGHVVHSRSLVPHCYCDCPGSGHCRRLPPTHHKSNGTIRMPVPLPIPVVPEEKQEKEKEAEGEEEKEKEVPKEPPKKRNVFFHAISRRFEDLEELVIQGYLEIAGLEELFRSGFLLFHLHSSGRRVNRQASKIRVLNLESSLPKHPLRCSRLLRAISLACPSLTQIKLSYCTGVTDAALRDLFTHCRQLKKVDVTETQIGVNAMRAMIEFCELIEWLSLGFPYAIPDDILHSLLYPRENLKYLQRLKFYPAAGVEYRNTIEAVQARGVKVELTGEHILRFKYFEVMPHLEVQLEDKSRVPTYLAVILDYFKLQNVVFGSKQLETFHQNLIPDKIILANMNEPLVDVERKVDRAIDVIMDTFVTDQIHMIHVDSLGLRYFFLNRGLEAMLQLLRLPMTSRRIKASVFQILSHCFSEKQESGVPRYLLASGFLWEVIAHGLKSMELIVQSYAVISLSHLLDVPGVDERVADLGVMEYFNTLLPGIAENETKLLEQKMIAGEHLINLKYASISCIQFLLFNKKIKRKAIRNYQQLCRYFISYLGPGPGVGIIPCCIFSKALCVAALLVDDGDTSEEDSGEREEERRRIRAYAEEDKAVERLQMFWDEWANNYDQLYGGGEFDILRPATVRLFHDTGKYPIVKKIGVLLVAMLSERPRTQNLIGVQDLISAFAEERWKMRNESMKDPTLQMLIEKINEHIASSDPVVAKAGNGVLSVPSLGFLCVWVVRRNLDRLPAERLPDETLAGELTKFIWY